MSNYIHVFPLKKIISYRSVLNTVSTYTRGRHFIIRVYKAAAHSVQHLQFWQVKVSWIKFEEGMTNILHVAGPNIFACINKYRFLNLTTFKYRGIRQITITDTVITSVKEKASVGLILHCTGSQGYPFVSAVFPPIRTHFLLNLVITKRSAPQQKGTSARRPSSLSLWLPTQCW